EITFKPPDPADISCEPCPAYFFVDFINKFPLLQYIKEARERTRIDTQDPVADDMVGNTGEFHDNHAHVLDPFGYFDTEQLLDRHMPTHIVDGRRAIVETVS